MVSLSLADNFPRDIFRGLMRFAHERQRFSIRYHDQDRHTLDELVEFCQGKAAVGLIVAGLNDAILQTARRVGLPTVNVSTSLPATGFPSVLVDNIQVGRLAADYLLRKGSRQQVFIHLPEQEYSQRRMQGWKKRLREEGRSGTVLPFNSFHAVMQEMERLQRPLAITAATDHLARSILDRCLNVGWSIPDEVMILGCSNNELVCEGGLVTLSSVPIMGERVGMIAGQILTEMVDGGPTPAIPVLVEPGPVVERESTDLAAVVEPSLADAIRFIRTHACQGIRITDVLKVTGLSRATLDRQVKRTLGHSPHEEIRRLQIERARHLLANTHQPLTDVAAHCGFKEPNYFMRVFREETGLTPTEFRRDMLSKADGVFLSGPSLP